MPDMVISDLHMPVMNGQELIENIKARGYGVPVILMTSFGNE
jgi:CheY-like chemotaxis protein